MAQCKGINSDPDISGIGIRVNFYATTLLIALIPKTAATEPVLETLFTNAGLSGLALLITAIIQTAKDKLDLYHAIYIQHLLFFLGLGIFPAAKYSWGTFRLVMTSLFRLVTYIMYLAWSLYLWTHVPSFGSQPECNDRVEYVVFVGVRATATWLGKLWIAALTVSAGLLAIWVVGKAGVVLYKRFYKGEEDAYRDEDEEGGGMTWWNGLFTLVLLLTSVYSVVMLQLFVNRNDALVLSGEQAWSFGQILSLVMIFASANEVLHFLFGLRLRRDSYDEDGYPRTVAVTENSELVASKQSGNRRWMLWKKEVDNDPGLAAGPLDPKDGTSTEVQMIRSV